MPEPYDHNQPTSDDNDMDCAFNPNQGEDEGSAFNGSNDEEVHEDQKPLDPMSSGKADTVAENDPHKAEKLTEAGRDIDPDEGSE
jgi:hypothetical protein